MHNRCLLCLDDIIKERLSDLTDAQRALVEPSAADLHKAPVGNQLHRVTACPRTRKDCKVERPNFEKLF